jgi:hypothetical protein
MGVGGQQCSRGQTGGRRTRGIETTILGGDAGGLQDETKDGDREGLAGEHGQGGHGKSIDQEVGLHFTGPMV